MRYISGTSKAFASLGLKTLLPPVTLLVPAHNEQQFICTAVRNLLDLDYQELEVIVINDGSTDETLQMMQKEFRLRPGPCQLKLLCPTVEAQSLRSCFVGFLLRVLAICRSASALAGRSVSV